MLYPRDPRPYLKWEEVSVRMFGQPKISKPSDLKGMNDSFKVKLHSKCVMPCFVKGDSIYVKCRDYFSTDDSHGPLQGAPMCVRASAMGLGDRKKKFIYDDNWGSIVFRNEAWLKVTGISKALEIAPIWQIVASLVDVASEFYMVKYGFDDQVCSDWERAIQDIVILYDKFIDNLQ